MNLSLLIGLCLWLEMVTIVSPVAWPSPPFPSNAPLSTHSLLSSFATEFAMQSLEFQNLVDYVIFPPLEETKLKRAWVGGNFFLLLEKGLRIELWQSMFLWRVTFFFFFLNGEGGLGEFDSSYFLPPLSEPSRVPERKTHVSKGI